jgi:NAD(P)-dependent dehydrogenase (short-subunit alcohol dehydrogenase family)
VTTVRDLTGRTAVVTGGARGLGRAAAERLSAGGARVAIVDLDLAAATAVAGTLCEGSLAIQADVAVESDVERYVATAADELGRIDMFFNNAGIMGATGDFFELSAADFDAVMGVNLRGVFLGLREVGRVMRGQGGGAIVNTASTAGLRGGGVPLYSTTKWGVVGLTRTVARLVGPEGIRVNAICPTSTPTDFFGPGGEDRARLVLDGQIEQIPLRRLGAPRDTAAAVAWLLSDEAEFVTGTTLTVDGGFTA